jgi:hypothetical protein
MGETELPSEGKNVIGYAENINKTLSAALGFTALVVATRSLGYDELKYHDLRVPLNYTVAVVFLGTIVHIYWARYIILNLHKLADQDLKDSRHQWLAMLFKEIKDHKGLFLKGLEARSQPVRKGSRIVKMSTQDPTTGISYLLVVLTIVAILPWHIHNGLRWAEPWWVAPAYAIMAVILVAINWSVGAMWIVTLSLMKDDPKVRWGLETSGLHGDPLEGWNGGSMISFDYPALGRFAVRQSVAICGFTVVIGLGLVIAFPQWWLWILIGSVVVLFPLLLSALLNAGGVASGSPESS